tara:strand:+ start:1007 stop:1204 length:198 start_codon:yes stop_codon:yes gene_type:complete
MDKEKLFLHILQIIDLATKRGAWNGNELQAVATIRQSIVDEINELKDAVDENLETMTKDIEDKDD